MAGSWFFDGADDRLSAPDSTVLRSPSSALVMGGWMRPTGNQQTNASIIEKMIGTSDPWASYHIGASATTGGAFRAGVSTGTATQFKNTPVGATLALNAWYFFFVNWNTGGTGTVRLRIWDVAGTLVVDVTSAAGQTANIGYTAQALLIAENESGGNWPGYLACLGVHNVDNRATVQIPWRNQGFPPFVPSAFYLPLDSASPDDEAQGNVFTASGGAAYSVAQEPPIQTSGPRIVDVSTVRNTATAASHPVPYPTQGPIQVGDYLVCVFKYSNATIAPTGIDNGFVEDTASRRQVTGAGTTTVFTKFATAQDVTNANAAGSATVTFGQNTASNSAMFAIRGVDPTTPIVARNGVSNTASVPTATIPSVTTLRDDTLLLWMAGGAGTPTFSWPNAGMNFNEYVDPGTSPGVAVTYQLQAAAGASGTRVVTSSITQANMGLVLAIQPPVAGTTHNRSPADAIVVADLAGRAGAFLRSESDAILVDDAEARVVGLSRAKADAFLVADAAGRVVSLGRSESDAIAVADTPSRAQGLSRSEADAILVADAAARQTATLRTATDSILTADGVARVLAKIVGVADATVVADAASRAAAAKRSASDAALVADAASRATVSQRLAADAVVLADGAARVAAFRRSASDAALVADGASRQHLRLLLATASDAIAVADAASRIFSVRRTPSDVVGATDLASRQVSGALGRAASDAIAVADTGLRAVAYRRTQADSSVLADAAGRGLGAVRSKSDSVLLADASARAMGHARTEADALVVADLASRASSNGRSVVDGLALADAASRTSAALRAVLNAIAVADAASRTVQGPTLRAVADLAGVVDSASRQVASARQVANAAAITDAASGLISRSFVRLKGDAVGVGDAVLVWVGFIAAVKPEVVLELLEVPEGQARLLPLPGGTLVLLEIPEGAAKLLAAPQGGEVEILDTPAGEIRFES